MPQTIYRIHPAIGIARVGNADRSKPDFFFLGPEVPGIPANYDAATKEYGSFKLDGRVRPQAVRFRIFEIEVDDDGTERVAGEVSLGQNGVTAVDWTVHVANKKASFVNFDGHNGAYDTPYFSSRGSSEVRNKNVAGADLRRQQLELDPGPKTIAGAATGKVDLSSTQGAFALLKEIKTLGELRSDPEGRLIFIGGMGFAESVGNTKLENYANNPGWFDDVSDGPVSATLTVNGKRIDADGAWIVTAPPDFAPALPNYRSMYDTLADIFVRADSSKVLPPEMERLRRIWKDPEASKPSFTADIYPVLHTMSQIWRVYLDKGAIEPGVPPINYHRTFDEKAMKLLGTEDEFDLGEVERIVERIRHPDTTSTSTKALMPHSLGNEPYQSEPKTIYHSVSRLQYHMLKAWSQGNAELDWAGAPVVADPTDVSPHGLDQAALMNAIGGAFYPGIEMGWLSTKPEVYRSPLRFALGKTVGRFAIPGPAGTMANVVVEAGAFSQQMAQPWHADFLACSQEGDPARPGKFIAWWPVQRPDHVFPRGETQYRYWTRTDAADGQFGNFAEMVAGWSTRGFVVHVDGDLFEVEGPDIPSV